MSTLLSPEEFAQALRNMRGMPESAPAESVRYYDGAARAARSALSHMPSLGFFSSGSDRIAAFLSICKHLDTLVQRKDISQDEAILSLLLMMVSDKGFLKAFTAFTNSVPQFRSDLTTNSETADIYWRSLEGRY
jgi:hypothetical protein